MTQRNDAGNTTAGNVPDSQPYTDRIDYIKKDLGLRTQETCADSGYDANLFEEAVKRIMKKMGPKDTPVFCSIGVLIRN